MYKFSNQLQKYPQTYSGSSAVETLANWIAISATTSFSPDFSPSSKKTARTTNEKIKPSRMALTPFLV